MSVGQFVLVSSPIRGSWEDFTRSLGVDNYGFVFDETTSLPLAVATVSYTL
jgi:hypothetical protein